MEERQRFEQIARELASGRMKEGTWARALAEAGSDPERARSLYVRMRNDQLSAESGSSADDDELRTMRGELARALKRSRHGSLYASIGLTADASDAQIAAALARLRKEGLPAEMRYAAETLGVPARRIDYDRRLLSQVLPGMGASHDFSVLERRAFRPLRHGAMLLLALALLCWAVVYLVQRGGEIQEQERQAFEARRRAAVEAELRQQQQAEATRYRLLLGRGEASQEEQAAGAAGPAPDGAGSAQPNVLVEGDAETAQAAPAREGVADVADADPQDAVPQDPSVRQGQAAATNLPQQASGRKGASGDYWRCLNQALNEMSGAQAKEKCAPLR